MRTEDQVITQFNMRLIRAVMPQGPRKPRKQRPSMQRNSTGTVLT